MERKQSIAEKTSINFLNAENAKSQRRRVERVLKCSFSLFLTLRLRVFVFFAFKKNYLAINHKRSLFGHQFIWYKAIKIAKTEKLKFQGYANLMVKGCKR